MTTHKQDLLHSTWYIIEDPSFSVLHMVYFGTPKDKDYNANSSAVKIQGI